MPRVKIQPVMVLSNLELKFPKKLRPRVCRTLVFWEINLDQLVTLEKSLILFKQKGRFRIVQRNH